MSERSRKVAQKPERRARGFLHAAELAPGALKSAGAKRGFAELKLLTQWRAIAGERLYKVCRPVKVTYASRSASLGATLVIAVEGARAPEIEMRKGEIIERVNAFYGYRAVSKLRIDQSRSPSLSVRQGFAEEHAPFTPPAAPPVDGVADQRLALALGRLGANIKRKAAGQRLRPRQES
ncbi:MAG: DciA family protein [Pseudomonadota bacterium]